MGGYQQADLILGNSALAGYAGHLEFGGGGGDVGVEAGAGCGDEIYRDGRAGILRG